MSKTALVVDDKNMRLILSRLSLEEGFEIEYPSSAKEAILLI